ncbi:MAG: DUF192 domain-containing protein [Peptococcaceae bacterium]|nr:DUF192 domain-containing protein [Peptococcaceae bacterium]
MLMLVNNTKQTVLADNVECAHTFWRRFLGLMGRTEFPPGHALWLYPCNGVHTMGMRFPIDVVFLDTSFNILSVISRLPPWRFSPIIKDATQVIELPPGRISTTNTTPGDALKILKKPSPEGILKCMENTNPEHFSKGWYFESQFNYFKRADLSTPL